MEKTIKFALVLALFATHAEAFWTSHVLEGKLDRPIKLIPYGQKALETLKPGEVTILLERQGYMLDSEARLNVGGKTYVFRVPRSAYYNDTDFNVSARHSGQPVLIEIRKKLVPPVIRKPVQKEVERVCFRPGFCTPSPQMQYGQYPNCPGTRRVIANVTERVEPYEVRIRESSSGEVIARIDGGVLLEQSVEEITETLPCQTGFDEIVEPRHTTINPSRMIKRRAPAAGKSEESSEQSAEPK